MRESSGLSIAGAIVASPIVAVSYPAPAYAGAFAPGG